MSLLCDSLQADGPAAEYRDELMLFGQFVGAWEVDLTNYQSDGTTTTGSGDWHFGWALGGFAIVDVWRVPGREHGMSVRFYDPSLKAWRSCWSGPRSGRQIVFTAGARGDEIVLEGLEDGNPVQWIFSKIEADSFEWRAVISPDSGATWRLLQEMRLTRKPVGRVTTS